MKTAKQVMKEWVAAMNSANALALAELYHEDAVNLQIPIGEPLVGKKAIHKDFVDFFASIPDNYTREENMVENDGWVALEWSGGGTYKPNGKTFKLRGSGFFQVVDGKIKLQRGYWDKATLFGQMGAPIDW